MFVQGEKLKETILFYCNAAIKCVNNTVGMIWYTHVKVESPTIKCGH